MGSILINNKDYIETKDKCVSSLNKDLDNGHFSVFYFYHFFFRYKLTCCLLCVYFFKINH